MLIKFLVWCTPVWTHQWPKKQNHPKSFMMNWGFCQIRPILFWRFSDGTLEQKVSFCVFSSSNKISTMSSYLLVRKCSQRRFLCFTIGHLGFTFYCGIGYRFLDLGNLSSIDRVTKTWIQLISCWNYLTWQFSGVICLMHGLWSDCYTDYGHPMKA